MVCSWKSRIRFFLALATLVLVFINMGSLVYAAHYAHFSSIYGLYPEEKILKHGEEQRNDNNYRQKTGCTITDPRCR